MAKSDALLDLLRNSNLRCTLLTDILCTYIKHHWMFFTFSKTQTCSCSTFLFSSLNKDKVTTNNFPCCCCFVFLTLPQEIASVQGIQNGKLGNPFPVQKWFLVLVAADGFCVRPVLPELLIFKEHQRIWVCM